MSRPKRRSTLEYNRMKRHKSVAHTTNMISRLKSVETWDDHGNSFSAVFHRLHDKEKQTSIEWSDNGFPMFNPKNVWRRRWDHNKIVKSLRTLNYHQQRIVPFY